jgi:hypothetical protein
MKLLQYVLLLAWPILSGCRSDVALPESRHFPKTPRFSILPQNSFAGSGLEFDAVYTSRSDPPANSDRLITYSYLRFWPNGRVLSNYRDHVPTKQDAEDFTHAYLGYYQVTNDKVTAELFVPNNAKFQWDYVRIHLTVRGDTIVKKMEEMGGQTLRSETTYQKTSFDKLERQPDW